MLPDMINFVKTEKHALDMALVHLSVNKGDVLKLMLGSGKCKTKPKVKYLFVRNIA